MAKKAKGNRQQVILECTEHKESGNREHQGILQPKTEKTHLIVLKGRNTILYLKNIQFTEKSSKKIKLWQRKLLQHLRQEQGKHLPNVLK